MEPGTVTCCLARAELLSTAGQRSISWHFPGPTRLWGFFKQRVQRGLFHTGFFRPHQAAGITGSLRASLRCRCLRRHTALRWALPASCQDTDAGIWCERSEMLSWSVERNNLRFSNVIFHLCQGSSAFKFPVPLLFLTSETLAANFQTICLGEKMKNHGPKC